MSAKKTLYHVGIDGQGFVLRGAPDRPARTMEQAPLRGLNPSELVVDLDYKDASAFLPWAQTDWSGGFQEEQWKDNAAFLNGNNLEYFEKFGQVSLLNEISAEIADLGAGSVADTQEYNDLLYIGISSISPRLFSVDSADTVVNVVTGWTVISDFFDLEEHKGFLWLGLSSSTPATDSPLQTYDGTTFTDITLGGALASSTAVRVVQRIGERLYVAGFTGTASDGDALVFTDDEGATFTTLITKTGRNRLIREAEDVNGFLYFLIEDGIQTELWRVSGTVVTQIYRWNNLLQANVRGWNGNLYIQGIQDGLLRRYKWDGARLQVVFEERISGLDLVSNTRITMVPWRENLHTYGLTYDGIINSPGYVFKDSGNEQFPEFVWGTSANQVLYFIGDDGASTLSLKKLDASAFVTSGNVETGRFFASKIAVDKLWHSVTLMFEELATAETLQVEFSLDDGANYTSIGTIDFADVGAVTEFTLPLPENTSSRKINLRITLGGDGTSTPVLQAFTARFLILGDPRFRWSLDMIAFDEFTTLDGHTEIPERADELRQILYRSHLLRQIVDFEDVDFKESALDGALTATATTITIDSTNGFPEQGRIKINQEEIFYTAKNATDFLNCVRGARGTQAVAHSDNDAVSNKYRVLITTIGDFNPVSPTTNLQETILRVGLLEV